MAEQKYKRSILNVLYTNVPGARDHVTLLFAVLSIFLAAVLLSSFLFIKVIQVGHYAEFVIGKNIHLIILAWGVVWFVSFVYSVRAVLFISYRVAGPIKRMERVLDEVLNGKDTTITLRESDALSGLAKRINQLLALQKSEKLKEQKAVYDQYQQKVNDISQKSKGL